MSSEKTLAIVVRTIEFSETSLVVTLFTEDFGKIAALAKGARRPKGPFDAALDLLATCRVVFLRKSSGNLDLLTEAKLERRFRAATRSLPALYAGYYVAELLRDLTDDHDPHAELFKLADETLVALDENQDPRRLVLHFELSGVALAGAFAHVGRVRRLRQGCAAARASPVWADQRRRFVCRVPARQAAGGRCDSGGD